MDTRLVLWFLYALVFGLLASIVDLHSEEPQLPFLFLFVFASLFAFARPAQAWRLVLLVWICLPLLHVLNAAVALPSPRDFHGPARLFVSPLVAFFRCGWCDANHSPAARSVVSLIPIILGAAAGRAIGRLQVSLSE